MVPPFASHNEKQSELNLGWPGCIKLHISTAVHPSICVKVRVSIRNRNRSTVLLHTVVLYSSQISLAIGHSLPVSLWLVNIAQSRV